MQGAATSQGKETWLSTAIFVDRFHMYYEIYCLQPLSIKALPLLNLFQYWNRSTKWGEKQRKQTWWSMWAPRGQIRYGETTTLTSLTSAPLISATLFLTASSWVPNNTYETKTISPHRSKTRPTGINSQNDARFTMRVRSLRHRFR